MPRTPKDNTSGKGMVLTDRDRRIVAVVAECGVLSRSQIARFLQFGSVTRVNAVLLRLARHHYLFRRAQPSLRGTRRQLYTIGRRGVELLTGPDQRLEPRRWREVSDLFVEHRLLVNDVRLAFHSTSQPGYRLRQWRGERELRRLNFGCIPDAYGEYEVHGRSFAVFLEADNGTETLGRWRQKTMHYVGLTVGDRFQATFGRQFFRVLVVLPSERRLASVRREIARQTDRVFWLTTSQELEDSGPFAAIWQRPSGDTHQLLTS